MKSFEIHGIEQAVVLLMFALDRVFAHKVEGWRRARKGYRVEVMPGSRDMERDVMVKIYPIGLPTSDHIDCRFDKTNGEEWMAYKGQVSFEHSAKEIAGFAFDGSNATIDCTIPSSIITPRSHEQRFKEILARDAIYDCKRA